MAKQNRMPAIRFRGFVDPWEQRKLGDVVDVTSGFMGDSLLSDGKYHLTRIETIADGIVDERRVGYSNKKPDDMYLLKQGDILYSNINSISHMGKVAKYQGITQLYHGINLLRLQPKNNINSNFLLYLLTTEKCRNWAKTRANQAVSQASINQSLLITQEIASTSFEEQKKIGDYFRHLDHLITLHQRKYDKLVAIKKAMLEKMFPREGSRFPEIRFAGFAEPWEWRKVSDIAPLQRGFDLPASNVKAGKYPVVMSNGIGGYHSEYKAKGPGVVTGRSGTIGKLHYIEDDYWPHNTALWVTSFKGNYPKFIYYLYQQLGLEHFSSGSGVPTLNRNDVHDAIVSVPCVDEQAQIAACFSQLDNLIILHQRKLEKLQAIKKSMLEKMFA